MNRSKYVNVFWTPKKRLATLNLVPGFQVYGEKLIKEDKKEYREWDPYRSKIGAALMRGIEDLPIKSGSKVLYLGSASGTTASHISDIVGHNGKVFCIDIAPRVMRDLVFVAEKKTNMIPVLADASNPAEYELMVEECDFVFEDVAMPNQTEILIKNCQKFLKKGGYAMIAVKARSIDVTAQPSDIFEKTEKELSKVFKIVDKKRLEPFEKDHIMFLLKMK